MSEEEGALWRPRVSAVQSSPAQRKLLAEEWDRVAPASPDLSPTKQVAGWGGGLEARAVCGQPGQVWYQPGRDRGLLVPGSSLHPGRECSLHGARPASRAELWQGQLPRDIQVQVLQAGRLAPGPGGWQASHQVSVRKLFYKLFRFDYYCDYLPLEMGSWFISGPTLPTSSGLRCWRRRMPSFMDLMQQLRAESVLMLLWTSLAASLRL